MARMSRKALEKRIEELENAVRSLSQMHGFGFATMAGGAKWVREGNHPKLKVDLLRHPANTSYGYVGFEELVKFVVDGEPLKFKMEDKELVKEVYPDGSVLDVVKEKEKKLSYVAPKTVPCYIQGRDYSWYLESMYDKVKKNGD